MLLGVLPGVAACATLGVGAIPIPIPLPRIAEAALRGATLAAGEEGITPDAGLSDLGGGWSAGVLNGVSPGSRNHRPLGARIRLDLAPGASAGWSWCSSLGLGEVMDDMVSLGLLVDTGSE